jgi:hypothetical protein
VLLATLLAGCLQLDLGQTDAGTTASSSATAAADAGASVLSGTSCAMDSASSTTLCTSIDRCPGLAVDHDIYPDCGFRVPAVSFDLECVCGDFLCSMGTALTCAQAGALLADGSELAVCTQLSEGRCAARATSKPASSCDRTCASECTGDPGCLVLCGC